ncbi:MAG: hypothetical protein ACEPOV_09215 [Hyphomicrobiales bacterium]
MKVIEVKSKKHANQFLDIARAIYKNDPNFVCPLDLSINKIFDPKKNVFYSHGQCTRWILEDDNGNLIGRVAAFINENKAYTFDQPTGGMGFFECIENKEAAFLLFDTAKEWLHARGMKAMDGPINFGENDNFWGLLVEGFTDPAIGMQYNPPYYQKYFEEYGFDKYFEQVSNILDYTKKFPDRFWKIANWVRQKEGFSFEHFKFSNAKKYIRDLKEVYDNAWQFHENFDPIKEKDLYDSLEEAKGIIDEELIWFAYFEGKPIAFLVMYPDANQIFKKFNGKLNLWNKLRFLYYKRKDMITRTRIVIMGVVPQFQKYGLESAIFWYLNEVFKKKSYNEIELSWVGDFNPKMRALHESVGAVFGKRHITYRCLFDQEKTFKRSTIIPKDTKEKLK